jgi:hypothetical protein
METGEPSREWIDDLNPIVIEAINEDFTEDSRGLEPLTFKGQSQVLIPFSLFPYIKFKIEDMKECGGGLENPWSVWYFHA